MKIDYQWQCHTFSVNIACGPAEDRVLLTGLHAVADIYCKSCKTTLGWKYVSNTFFLRRTRCMIFFITHKKILFFLPKERQFYKWIVGHTIFELSSSYHIISFFALEVYFLLIIAMCSMHASDSFLENQAFVDLTFASLFMKLLLYGNTECAE